MKSIIDKGEASEKMVSQEYNKSHFDKNEVPIKHKKGDYIMLRNFDTAPDTLKKLIMQYKEPYTIV